MVNCIEQEVGPKPSGLYRTSGVRFVSGGLMAILRLVLLPRDNKLADINLHLGTAYISDQTQSFCGKRTSHYRDHDNRDPQDPDKQPVPDGSGKLEEEAIEQDQHPVISHLLLSALLEQQILEALILWLKLYVKNTICGSLTVHTALPLRKYRSLLRDRTPDSISWDAHKWPFQNLRGCALRS